MALSPHSMHHFRPGLRTFHIRFGVFRTGLVCALVVKSSTAFFARSADAGVAKYTTDVTKNKAGLALVSSALAPAPATYVADAGRGRVVEVPASGRQRVVAGSVVAAGAGGTANTSPHQPLAQEALWFAFRQMPLDRTAVTVATKHSITTHQLVHYSREPATLCRARRSGGWRDSSLVGGSNDPTSPFPLRHGQTASP
jgi:hypothetical protein